MAVAAPRSPAMAVALNSPIEFLPVTRFPVQDVNADPLREIAFEKQKERQVIQSQPYRTTQLVFPNPKPKPDFVNNRSAGKTPTVFRPLDQRSVVANLNENQALVSRQQYNSPRPLYSDQNVQEAIYVQTGVNIQQPQAAPQRQQAPPRPQMQTLQQPHQHQQQPLRQQRQPSASSSQLQQPIHRTPDALPEYKPQNSPTFQAILEEEGPGTLTAAPSIQKAPPQKTTHYTTPTYHLNSVGQPSDRIAQSHTFKRLMHSVMGEY